MSQKKQTSDEAAKRRVSRKEPQTTQPKGASDDRAGRKEPWTTQSKGVTDNSAKMTGASDDQVKRSLILPS